MAGIVGSAIAGEAVRRLSALLSGEESHDRETTEIKVVRVEMAMLKLETVVAMSDDWQITHPPLLRWKAKLKRVLKEGKGIVRTHRRNNITLERGKSFPRRMAQVVRRFVTFNRGTDHPGDDHLTDSTVRRFERIADGADDFLRSVRCGGRPKIFMFVPSFARSLSAGETMEFTVKMEGGTALMLFQPWWFEIGGGGGGGKQAMAFMSMSYEHDLTWERNFKVMADFRMSKAVDVMRVAANCVVLLPPQFGVSCVAAIKELVAGMASHGRNSRVASAMYISFVRAVQDSVTTLTPD